ncbi:SNF5 like [Cryptosporidium sp. chipmunk genotype I]|uniref:SNF5 like n=1 Tax=Cryptosporidium sp. chipmunk genotype I TaxID=1280935 RepID=UPI00351A4D0D|nr:SNF5 like [Cryptosporidium sp. chipmunk genotype I]
MGRKKIKNVLSIESHDGSDKSVEKHPQDSVTPEKKLIFEDHLLENTQLENITIADVKRITSKTFDFLRNTGLRQTHISATTGINQSILSIILRDPCTKTISINRKKDVVFKLCEYYKKINLGLISHDPLTAPKISSSKKNGETSQKKRTLPRRNTSEDGLNEDSILQNPENFDRLNSSQYNNLEFEKKDMNESQGCKIGSEGAIFRSKESKTKLADDFSNDECLRKNILLFSSCVGCPVIPTKTRKTKTFFIEDFSSGPISSFVNDNALIEFTELNHSCRLNDNHLKFNKNYDLTSRILEPILIPLSVNLRHFISSSFSDNYAIENGIVSSVPKSKSSAILSTLKGKNFKSEKFIWSSVSDFTALWGFVENLSRERHLSIFMNNSEKKKVFNWLVREIENYKSLYLQFLYVTLVSNINPGNDSLLICEIRLNESYEDIIVNDRFKWNIFNPTNQLKEYIRCLISDLNLPAELFSELLYSALKQVFDEITYFIKKFNHMKNNYITNGPVNSTLYIGDQYEDDTSSNYSFGANFETHTNDVNIDRESTRFVSYGNFCEWGNRADLEYDSDDNARLFPIIENAEERRQIENRNRFRKRR